jgi:hypothetical protein
MVPSGQISDGIWNGLSQYCFNLFQGTVLVRLPLESVSLGKAAYTGNSPFSVSPEGSMSSKE